VGAFLATGDVTDKDSVLEGMRGCDWVVNLANVYTFWEPEERIYTHVNVEGTRVVMECALETGVSKVLHASSMVVYGKPADVPFTEESPVGLVRFSEYAETKYQGDLAAWDLYQSKGLPLVMVYPAAVLGPGDHKATGQYIQDLIHRRRPATAFQDSIMTYVHVGDVAEAIVQVLEKENTIGGKYLIGKERLSNRELSEMISEISQVPLPRMQLPDSVVLVIARLLTGLAALTKKPPYLGLDWCRTAKEGFQGEGTKAERELGLAYTPIRQAVEEAIASYQPGG
jgi:dihydroflavonol-4-reductase